VAGMVCSCLAVLRAQAVFIMNALPCSVYVVSASKSRDEVKLFILMSVWHLSQCQT
jgi:hypothetical protein